MPKGKPTQTPLRAAKPEVNAVLRRLRNIGLQLEFSAGAGHWRVIDPGTGAFLTTVSGTPSDGNFFHQIRRAIEKAGFNWEGGRRRKIKKPRAGEVSAVDLEALAHAQRMARIHGGREPQVDDLADKSFLAKVRKGFNEQETEEAIENMAQGVESQRAHRVVSRLLYLVEQKGSEMAARAKERNPKIRGDGGAAHELIYVSQEVAKKRGLRYFKTPDSAWMTFNDLLNGTRAGMTVWVANLLEATMDDIDGLHYDAPGSKTAPATASGDKDTAEAAHRSFAKSTAPVVTLTEAKGMILSLLTTEWTLRPEIHSVLVPEQMANKKFDDGLSELAKEGLIERMREQKKAGSSFYRLTAKAAAASEPTPAPPEPTLEPEFEPFEPPAPRGPLAVMTAGTIADRYADELLGILRSFAANVNGDQDWNQIEPILRRLDMLAGVGIEE